jgi:hypothetical protein
VKRLLLLVLVDALGWDVLGIRSLLEGVAPVRRRTRTVLGYSSAAVPSLLTGRTPAETGHFSMYRIAGEDGVFASARRLAWLPRRIRERARVRIWYDRRLRAADKVRGYFNLYTVPLDRLPRFDLVERRDLFRPGGVAGCETIVDRMERSGLPYRVWSWRTPEAQSFREMHEEIERGEARILFVYAPELDADLHAEGTAGTGVTRRIQGYDATLRAALDTARSRYDDVRLFVFSDHGQADVVRTVDLMGRVRALPWREGDDYLAFYDSTMARFWIRKEGFRRDLLELAGREEGVTLLTPGDLARLGVLYEDARYGDTVLLLDEGVAIEPSYMGLRAPKGMHGYHPDAAGSYGVWLGTHETPRVPDSILDIHGVVSREIDEASE